MRVPQSYIQKCKVVAHVFQVLLIFIAGCLTLAVLTKGGEIGGATRYYFALCFLTFPAIIYLVMVPMWSRAKKFANAYAFIALDALYTVLWFGAFIAIAMWNSSGIRQGAVDAGASKDDGNCSTFKWGSESKCKISRATVGFGVVIFVFFAITAGISGYYLVKFRKEGVLPYESEAPNPHHISGETAKDPTWSTEMDHNNHADSDDDDDDRRTERGGNQEEDEYALLHSTETDEGRHPGRPLSWGDDRPGYGRGRPGGSPGYATAAYDENPDAAGVLSPGGYEEYRREASGSSVGGSAYGQGGTGYAGNGGHGGQGYSFTGGDR